MKWSPWPPTATASKKFLVKVKPLKLEGFDVVDGHETVAVEMRWKGSKSGLVSFRRTPKLQRSFSSRRAVRRGESVEWDDEFESVCSFSVSSNSSFAPWEVSFKILHANGAESKRKMALLGKTSVNLAELASKMEPRIERKVPITLQAGAFNREAALLISVSFVEIRNSQDVFGIVQNAAELDKQIAPNTGESNKEDWFFKRILRKKTKIIKTQEGEPSFADTDESAAFDSEGSPKNESVGVIDSSPETQLDSVQKVGFLSWKRKRTSSTSVRKQKEPLIQKTAGDDSERVVTANHQLNGPSSIDSIKSESIQIANVTKPSEPEHQDDNVITSGWERKELLSRDGQAKLKANVFFASFDQRSEQAAGESACTALVTVIAHWLRSNRATMPTRSELDHLITEGSLEWQKLCNNKDYINRFPDKHFDLETVLNAKLRPLSVLPEKSFVGFFSPEKFESLKGAMSFDEIWNDIVRDDEDCDPKVYIVSWNDHFFVLKVEANACYLIDTLGERLFEGCNRAYVLKFDESALMSKKVEKEEVSSEGMAGLETCERGEEGEEIICRGKDCCREFMKRFLAAIPLGEMVEEEKRGTVCSLSLHQRLQIEFHFSSSSSSPSSSSATSSTSSLFSIEEYD